MSVLHTLVRGMRKSEGLIDWANTIPLVKEADASWRIKSTIGREMFDQYSIRAGWRS